MGAVMADWTFQALVFISLGLLVVYAYLKRNFNYWKKLGVLQLEPTVLFGNAADCIFAKVTPAFFYHNIYQKGEGKKMIGFYIADEPCLMVRDPDLIKSVLIKDFNNFSNKIMSHNFRDEIGSKTLFLIENPPWKIVRQKLTPMFTSGRMKRMFDLMIEIGQDFEKHLIDLEIDEKIGKPLDVSELCGKLTTDLIGTTAFGMRFNSLTDPNAEFRNHGRRMFRSSYKRYLQMIAIFFMPPLRPFFKAQFFDDQGTTFLKNTFWDVMNERARTGIKRNDLIDLLLEIKQEQEKSDYNNYKLDDDILVSQAAGFFAAGFETSSTTMSFALYELARNPEIQTRLRNEISRGLEKSDGKITYELMTTLPYLNMVIHETLRMYPILAWIDRTADTDYTFNGTNVTIKKGTPVIAPMYSLHMDPKYFPNPEKFDPERFSEEKKNDIKPFTYFPFGQGPRNCIGNRLGLLQTKMGVFHVISKYELTPCVGTPIPMTLAKLNIFLRASDLSLNFRKISA